MKTHLWIVIILFLLSSYLLYSLLAYVDPFNTNQSLMLALFFVLTFFSLSLFFGLTLFFSTEIWQKKTLGQGIFSTALRRGVFLGLTIMIGLGLQLFNLFGWLEIGAILFFFLLIELVIVRSRVGKS